GYEQYWLSLSAQAVPPEPPVLVPCGRSDIAGPGQSVGFDGELTADDIIVYLNGFFAGDPIADVAGPGQSATPDRQFTADDIIVFLNRFFAGC
ncbi:MAG: GC-type dockerin domain-anchored protein, partial [bacterium]